jgi:hypothetical protein
MPQKLKKLAHMLTGRRVKTQPARRSTLQIRQVPLHSQAHPLARHLLAAQHILHIVINDLANTSH